MESLSSSSNNTTQSSQTTQTQSGNTSENNQKSEFELAIEDAKNELTTAALEVVTEEGLNLLSEYTGMIKSLSPKQKEYVMNIAILKTQKFDDMSAIEIIELGKISIKTSELGLEISDELGSFWAKFNDVVLSIADKFQEIGTKVIATSLVGVLF